MSRGTFGKPFWITLFLVCLLKLLFVVTYPLNVSGDGFTYFRMIATRSSNLAHAGGYPFLVGLPLAFPRAVLAALRGPGSALVEPVEERRPGTAAGVAQGPPKDVEAKQALLPVLTLYVTVANHLMDALAVAALFLLLRAIFSVTAAVLGALVYGLNPWNVQWATLSRPEQVQSNLLVLMVAALYWARQAETPRRKRAGYAAAAALFALCALAKFNAALFVLLPAVALLADPSSWRERARLGAISLATGAAVYGVFVILYHAPSTGTYALAYARGHNLYVRLQRNPLPLFGPENGIASKKFAILSRVLPLETPFCCGPTLFSRVDWVPPDERRPYRERYLPLLRSQDRRMVEQLYAAVRDRPAGEWHSIHYHLGLKEGDDLLSSVFFEAVRSRPAAYLEGAGLLFLEVFTERPEVLVPVLDPALGADPPLNLLADAGKLEAIRLGFIRIATSGYRSRELDYKGSPAIWLPGVRIVTTLLSLTSIPTLLFWAVIGIGVLLSLRGTGADPGAARWGPALLLVSLLVFIAAWSLLFNVRNKDVRLVQPLLDALVAVGLWRIGGGIRRGAAAMSRAWS
ncbi:MAG: glycosyltransferase family 39 protein [Candidatus Rokubacteria bacterium]|nr:glycosyltransferase family 39 protein [Candidatus Rokubacteria bacterium]